jgi:hypothetical protein
MIQIDVFEENQMVDQCVKAAEAETFIHKNLAINSTHSIPNLKPLDTLDKV